MRVFLASVALIAALVWGLLFIFLGDQQPTERHYIQGMYPRPQRYFGDYLEPVTDQGLREIRSDHMARSASYTISTASSTSTMWVAVSAGSTISCSEIPMSMTTAYTHQ